MRVITLIALLFISFSTFAQQNVGIGTTTPDSSAVLELSSNNKGILIPRLTRTQRNSIYKPKEGLMIYLTDSVAGFYYYNGTAWKSISNAVNTAEKGGSNGITKGDTSYQLGGRLDNNTYIDLKNADGDYNRFAFTKDKGAVSYILDNEEDAADIDNTNAIGQTFISQSNGAVDTIYITVKSLIGTNTTFTWRLFSSKTTDAGFQIATGTFTWVANGQRIAIPITGVSIAFSDEYTFVIDAAGSGAKGVFGFEDIGFPIEASLYNNGNFDNTKALVLSVLGTNTIGDNIMEINGNDVKIGNFSGGLAGALHVSNDHPLAATFGKNDGSDRIILGNWQNEAFIGTSNPNAASTDNPLTINPFGGKLKIAPLVGTGNRLLKVNALGIVGDTTFVGGGAGYGKANATDSGYLSSADWNNFNNKTSQAYNGLNKYGDTVAFGGFLTKPTSVTLQTNSFEIIGGNIQTGQTTILTPHTNSNLYISDFGWQTIKPLNNGTMEKIIIPCTGFNFMSGNLTYTLYDGAGTGGTVLATGTIALGKDDAYYSLNLNVPCVVNQVFSLALSATPGSMGIFLNSNNGYADGKLYDKYGNEDAYSDLAFQLVQSTGTAISSFYVQPYSGNVGINTKNPTAELHVAGNVKIDHGYVSIDKLAGNGDRMVIADAHGYLLTQNLPKIDTANATNTGVITNTDWSIFNNKQNTLSKANATDSGYLTSADWNIFNNKQNTLTKANATDSGYLSSNDWNLFNAKQNTLSKANTTDSGYLSSADWNAFNNKFSLPSLNSGSILFSNGSTISENNSQLFWNNTNGSLGIGTSAPSSKLHVTGVGGLTATSTNDGTGTGDWIAANFGGTSGNRVVAGVFNGIATIGGHSAGLGGWSDLDINPGGSVKFSALAGTGVRYATINATGVLGVGNIPTAATNATGLLTLTDWNTFNNKQNALSNAGTSVSGILNSTDWNTFNNKQNALSNASTSVSGILSSTDWNTFNNKQNALSNASTSVSGILSSTDWNTFNNKQNALSNASTSVSGILSSTDWNTFNNKQNALSNASTSVSGILSSTDWNTFNNKQNALSNASTSVSGILSSTDWNTFNNKYNLPSLTNGSILFSNGTTIAQNNSSFNWDNANTRLRVNALNNGTLADGFNNWIAAHFGGTGGNRVVMGIQSGEATIGAHNNALNAWAGLTINPAGSIKMPSLNSSGTKMVTVAADGSLASQAIPTGEDNLGNHTATQTLNVNNNWISNDGTTKGIKLDNAGNVVITTGSPTTAPTIVTGNMTFDPVTFVTTFEVNGTSQPKQLSVNGSIRQTVYSVPVSIAYQQEITITWNHNLGYNPIVMMSTDGNGSGGNGGMQHCSYTTHNLNNNTTIFTLLNNSANTFLTLTGNFKWIIVH